MHLRFYKEKCLIFVATRELEYRKLRGLICDTLVQLVKLFYILSSFDINLRYKKG